MEIDVAIEFYEMLENQKHVLVSQQTILAFLGRVGDSESFSRFYIK